jgi:hypothetical protein
MQATKALKVPGLNRAANSAQALLDIEDAIDTLFLKALNQVKYNQTHI